jgi:hypothetical protein
LCFGYGPHRTIYHTDIDADRKVAEGFRSTDARDAPGAPLMLSPKPRGRTRAEEKLKKLSRTIPSRREPRQTSPQRRPISTHDPSRFAAQPRRAARFQAVASAQWRQTMGAFRRPHRPCRAMPSRDQGPQLCRRFARCRCRLLTDQVWDWYSCRIHFLRGSEPPSSVWLSGTHNSLHRGMTFPCSRKATDRETRCSGRPSPSTWRAGVSFLIHRFGSAALVIFVAIHPPRGVGSTFRIRHHWIRAVRFADAIENMLGLLDG